MNPLETMPDFKRPGIIMTRRELVQVWQSADCHKVIEEFQLRVDPKRSTADEIAVFSPWTDETEASCFLNVKKKVFIDHSAGKEGTLPDFCQEILKARGETLNIFQVGKWMVEKGIAPQPESVALAGVPPLMAAPTVTESVDEADAEAATAATKATEEGGQEKRAAAGTEAQPENREVKHDLRNLLQYHKGFEERGISEATCRYLGAGYLPPMAKGKSKLGGRLVFQVRGLREGANGPESYVVAYQGRALTAEQAQGRKYDHYPFKRKLEIYNQDKWVLDSAARAQVEEHGVLLVEGVFDLAKLVEAGVLNAGALLGKDFHSEQVRKLEWLKKWVAIPRVLVWLDRGEAEAQKAAETMKLLQAGGFEAGAFDWGMTFTAPGGEKRPIPKAIGDPCDMSAKQIQWLRGRGFV